MPDEIKASLINDALQANDKILQAKDEALQANDKILQAKDEALQALKNGNDKILQAKDEALQAKDERIKDLEESRDAERFSRMHLEQKLTVRSVVGNFV